MTTVACNLKCEHLPRPLGVGTPYPRLSWKIKSDGQNQTQAAYRIQVWEDTVDGEPQWDSSKTQSSQQHEVAYSGTPLQIRTRYFWRVRVSLNDGTVSDWSEPASFETGFFSMRDWKADWIVYGRVGNAEGDFGKESVVFVRREFNVKDVAQLKRARVHVAATAGAWGNDTLRMNLYEFRLNGEKVGGDFYNPGHVSDLKQRALYRTYDLSGLLNEGANAVGMIFVSKKVSFELMLEYQNGQVEFVRSGEGGKTTNRRGPFVQLWDRAIWEYGGKCEHYDAREEFTNWDRPGFDDKTWRKTNGGTASPWILAPQMISVESYNTFKPQRIVKLPDERYVVDFGHCMMGFVEIKVPGPSGTKVKMRFSEAVKPDGSIHPASTYGCSGALSIQENVYTKRGDGLERYSPHFATYAFRYVEITGWPSELHMDDLQVNALCSAVGKESSFACSDERVMQLQRLCERTFLSNLMSVPTDSAARERMGWPGDASCVSTAECAMFDMGLLYEHWFDQVSDEQNPDGNLPYVIPSEQTLGRTDMCWSTCYGAIAWDAFMTSGDLVFLARYYDIFKRWADYVLSLQGQSGLSQGHHLFGDWLSKESCDGVLLENVFAYRALVLAAKIAEALNLDADASHYRGSADQLRSTINKKYLHDGVYGKGSQSESVLVLALGIAPVEVRGSLFAKVCKQLEEDLSFRTGIIGTQLLMRLLAEEGRDDLAWNLAMSDKLGAWRYWIVKNGATTALEDWDGGDRQTNEHERNRTCNQPAFAGGIAEWLYRELAGIKPLTPGYETVCIAPYMPDGMEHASAKIQTPFGPVTSAWKSHGAAYELEVKIPVGTKAEVHLPTGSVHKVGSGKYTFSGEQN